MRIEAADRAGRERLLHYCARPPRVHRHRYFGVRAPNSPLRAAVTALALAATTSLPTPTTRNPPPNLPHRRAARYAWALLLARIHEVFPLVGPIGGGAMRIIAFITDVPSVRDILLHLGEPTAPQQPLGDVRPPFLSVGTPASTRDNLIRWRLVQLNLLSVILRQKFTRYFEKESHVDAYLLHHRTLCMAPAFHCDCFSGVDCSNGACAE